MNRKLVVILVAAALPFLVDAFIHAATERTEPAHAPSPQRVARPSEDGSASGAAVPPEWFLSHMAFMTQGSGRWIADNAPFKSEGEPNDAYGTEWNYGAGKKSMTGRLFAFRDGKELGTIWEFRVFWDPGRRQARIIQFGRDGTLGEGELTSTGEKTTRSEQTFSDPSGGSTIVGHDTSEEPGVHVTRSFDVKPDGTRVKRRDYAWKLQPEP